MKMTIDDAVKNAVVTALARRPSRAAMLTEAAEAICASQGVGGGCYCGRGLWKRCHAVALYGDMALAVIDRFERKGHLPRRRT